MKKILVFTILLLSTITIAQNKESVKKYSDVSFSAIKNPPVFPGCEEGLNSRKCFSTKIREHVAKNFDIEIAEEIKLYGKIKIFSSFKVDYKGFVTDIKVRAPHRKLKKETKRVIKALPKMAPAYQNGKPVNLLFTLPIVFNIEPPVEIKGEEF